MGRRRSRARPELVLTPSVLRDRDQLERLTSDLLLEDVGLQRLSRRIRRLQGRLRKLVDDKAWAAFLELEEAYSERLGDAIDVFVTFAFEQGRLYGAGIDRLKYGRKSGARPARGP